MLANLLDRLLRRAPARPEPDPEPAPWWLAAYEQADTTTCFGPAERSELGRLMLHTGLRPGGPPSYTLLHGYLTGIVIGPRGTPAQRWLAHLLNGVAPAEGDAAHARLIALIRRTQAHIGEDFLRREPHLRMAARDVGQGPKTKTPGPLLLGLDQWCAGVLHATEVDARWAELGPAHDEDSLLHLLWTMGTADGRQDRIDEAHRIYREDGFDERQASMMVSRFLQLPSSQRRIVAGLRQTLLDINAYWASPRRRL